MINTYYGQEDRTAAAYGTTAIDLADRDDGGDRTMLFMASDRRYLVDGDGRIERVQLRP